MVPPPFFSYKQTKIFLAFLMEFIGWMNVHSSFASSSIVQYESKSNLFVLCIYNLVPHTHTHALKLAKITNNNFQCKNTQKMFWLLLRIYIRRAKTKHTLTHKYMHRDSIHTQICPCKWVLSTHTHTKWWQSWLTIEESKYKSITYLIEKEEVFRIIFGFKKKLSFID
mgnify:CR=1 FL=1